MTTRLLKVTQAADVLGCSPRTLRRRIADGALPVFRDGGLIRVREVDLERYVAANVSSPALARAGARTSGVVLPGGARLWDE